MRTGRSLTVWRGVCFPGGVPPSRGVPPSGGCLLLGGLLGRGRGLLGREGVPPLRGVSLAGGSPWRGVSLAGGLLGRGGGIPACTEADPPVNRMTDRCKNITLATTSLRPVMSVQHITLLFQPIDKWFCPIYYHSQGVLKTSSSGQKKRKRVMNPLFDPLKRGMGDMLLEEKWDQWFATSIWLTLTSNNRNI